MTTTLTLDELKQAVAGHAARDLPEDGGEQDERGHRAGDGLRRPAEDAEAEVRLEVRGEEGERASIDEAGADGAD